ncbi:hypothetical protein FK268_09150 [Tsukamurella sputi]|uniref:ARB-07466-like C-terminal domain-containing protein n=1 Tax=Tsukamurella sputi TaxID=2591848 RepID=A0A5C5RS19_9ACTN|nr:hypothetical protein [Tsukamurella sputi]TWS25348.1 hypothetical protein FK268_09150 [Tsukamurella sputi]
MADYSAGKATIKVEPTLDDFAEKLRAGLERIHVVYTVDVDADIARAREQLDQLARTRTAQLRVDLDPGDTEARLDALARNRTARIDVNDGGSLGRVSSGADRAGRSLNAMGAIKFGALAAGITALVPALLGAVGAASALAGVLGGIGATGLVGISGIKDAFSAMKDMGNATGADMEAAANRIADAQDGVRRAQESVVDAQKKAKDAQDDLNASYEKASRALRDMNDQLTDAQLSQESAEISLARAEEARNKVYSDRKSTALDRAEADNRVKTAAQRVKEAKSDTADKTKDTAEANAKGIGGSDIVTKAKDAKEAADKSLVNAQVDLAKATRDLADAQKGATPGADKYAEALAKLSPNAREFVQAIKALGPEWKSLKTAVQDKMFDGLGASVTQFARQNLTGLQTTLTGIAGYMNTTFKDTLTGLSGTFAQLSANGTMTQFVQSIGAALQGVAPMISGLVQMVTTATAAMGPSLGTFFTTLGTTLGQMGPALGQLGAQLLTALTPVLPVIGQLVSAISTGLGPALDPLGQLIATFGRALVPLAEPLGQLIAALANGLRPVLPILAEALGPLIKLVADLLNAVAPLLPPLLQLANAILQPLITIISSVVSAMAPLIKQLADAFKPVIEKIAPILAEVGKTLGQALADAIKQLTPFMMPLVNAFLKLLEACLPLLPAWEQMIVSQLPVMVELMKVLLPIITKLIELFTWLVTNVIVPLVLKYFDILTEKYTRMGEEIRSFVDGAKKRWNDLVDFIGGLPDRIANSAKGMWEGLKGNLVTVINWILTRWNSLADTLTWKVPDIPGLPKRGETITMIPKAALLRADGGPVFGPGGPRADLIPSMLSNGEYVINAAAVAKYGVGMFDRLNAQRFADGGAVGTIKPTAEGLNAGADYLRTAIMQKFPAITTIGGRRAEDGYGEHSSGNAIDVMIPNFGSADGKALGAQVLAFLQENAATLQLDGIIYQQATYGYGGSLTSPKAMSDRGSDTQNHMDHLHVILGKGRGASAAAIPAPTGTLAGVSDAKPTTVDGQNVDGAWDPAKQEQQDGRNDPQKYQAPAPTTTSGSAPSSWSDVLGLGAQALVKGQVSSLLSVFGIPDKMPPILSAALDLPGHIVKRDASWKAPGLGNLTTPAAGGSQTNPTGDLLGKFIPGLANLPGLSSSTVAPAANVAGTAGPGATLPLTGQKGTPTTKTPAETLTSTLSAPPANYKGGKQATYDAAYKAFRESGLAAEEWTPLVNLINEEASWDPHATNGDAFGLGQMLGGTKAKYLPDSSSDPYVQVKAMIKYIGDRPDYGTPSKAWELWQSRSPHWYANGGLVSGPGGGRSDMIPALLSHGEYVVNAAQAALHMPALEAINAGQRVTTPLPPAPAPSTLYALQGNDSGGRGQGGDTIFNIRTATVEDAFMQAQTKSNQQRAAQLASL